MKFERGIGEKGQVVIPKDIRTFLGLKSGQKVVFEVRQKDVVLKSEDPESFLKDFFNVPKSKKSITLSEIKKELQMRYDLP